MHRIQNIATTCCVAAFLGLAFAPTACAEISAELNEAAQPISDGVPQVAVVRLRDLLARDGLAPPDRAAATLRLGEALIAAGEPEAALKALADPIVAATDAATFFRAQANAALGRWPDALALYQQLAAPASQQFRQPALVGRAEALRALGRPDEALHALDQLRSDPLWSVRAALRAVEVLLDKKDVVAASRLLNSIRPDTPAERKQRRFLSARVAFAQNDFARAVELFTSILKSPHDASHAVIMATLLGIAEANLRANSPDRGDDVLEDFIEHHPEDSDLPRIFAKLDELYTAERQQSRHELGRWSKQTEEPRRALSLWYLARAELRLRHRVNALDAFRELRAQHPQLPALSGAFIDEAQLLLEDGRNREAIGALEAARALQPGPAASQAIDFIAARAELAAHRYDLAAQTYQQIARTTPSAATAALYDASLAWLQSDDEPRSATAAQDLTAQSDGSEARADLTLERGLLEAKKANPHASESLLSFVRDFPTHPRAAEAWIALAELAFAAAPPRLDEARKCLSRAADTHPSPAAAEHADCLAIWIADVAPFDESKVIVLAEQFLQKHADSPRLPEVRLKLAEAFFRRQDFASAQTQFALLAQQNPTSPEAEKAQFFAAQSAMQSMGASSLDRALTLFDDVVKRNGPLKCAARNQQAVIERKLGKPQDALTLYDEVARSDANTADKRESLCGKADILYELGTSDRENYRRAIAVYDQLASDKGASPHWRNQALFKKGMCLEKLDAPTEALATFYKIVEDDTAAGRQREYFWFYKAGFNAARLLEEKSEWQPAAAIYEKLAFAGGDRSEEAKSRLNRLRLEHFLWDQ